MSEASPQPEPNTTTPVGQGSPSGANSGAQPPAPVKPDSVQPEPVQPESFKPAPARPGAVAQAPGKPGRSLQATPAAGQIDASLYLHPKTLARLGSMELRAKHIVEGVMSGTHRSPYKGVSVDFAQHRPYVSGDDLRHLDWKVYAKTDKLYLKQYEQETNLDLVVLVDCSGSMNYGSRSFATASGTGQTTSPDGRSNWTKYDHATALAAALSYITLHQGDRVGLAVFADEIKSLVARSNKRAAWRQVVTALSTQPATEATDLVRVMDQVLGKVTNRCLFAIISDFFADPDDIRKAIARIRHRGHDLIAFQVLDQAEVTFDFADHAPFVGLEGEPTLRVNPKALRQGYLDAMARHTALLEKHIHGFGYGLHRINTHDWLGPSLATFLARRNARIGKRRVGT